MNYKSKYFSSDVKLPVDWVPEEFWWVVEQLEKLEYDNLFLFCLELGVLEGKTPKESVSLEEMMKKILYDGDKDKILNALKKTGGYISKYFSVDYSPLPKDWKPEEFWWAVEQLEKFGNEHNLFDLAWSLGIKFDPVLKGKVKIVDLMIVILNEGGPKEKVIKAIKEFCGVDQRTRKRTF